MFVDAIPYEEVVTVERPAMVVVGIERSTSNDPAKGPKEIGEHWERFFNEGIFSQIPHRISDEIFALYCGYEGDYTAGYTIVIGCQVSSAENLPPGLVAKTVPASKYAAFQSKGDYPQSLVEVWNRIWQTPLARAYTVDFELYRSDFSQDPDHRVDVFVALQ